MRIVIMRAAPPRPTARRVVALGAAAVLLPLAGCGSAGGEAAAGTGTSAGGAEPALAVAASFYPLQWVTEAVAGERAAVTSLTAPGVEPHDLELSPREVGAAVDADVLVTLGGFQPAVDAAAAERGEGAVVDVAGAADLEVHPTAAAEDDHADHTGDEHADATDGHEHAEDDHAHDAEETGGATGDAHAEDEHAADDGHDHGLAEDPHFWLDPQRMASVAAAVADGLAAADPDGAATYQENLAAVTADLTALDEEYAAGLATCESRDLVTSHEAFGYLAERYDLVQRGVQGVGGGGSEPTPTRLAEVADFVEENGVRTIYTETLLDPAVAETVAAETGATTAVLDTLEGLTDASPADDYPGVMRANLEVLRTGQGCS